MSTYWEFLDWQFYVDVNYAEWNSPTIREFQASDGYTPVGRRQAQPVMDNSPEGMSFRFYFESEADAKELNRRLAVMRSGT